jgi:hypothetical protein
MKDKDYHRAYKREYAQNHKNMMISFTLEEYEEIKKLADNEDTKPTTFFKSRGFAYIHQKIFVPVDLKEDLKELKFLIRNIANNVNQIAHHSNLVEKLVNENEFLMQIKKLEDAVFDYTKKRLDTN